MPDDYAAYGAKWAAMNPGYTVKDWTEADILAETWHNQQALAGTCTGRLTRRPVDTQHLI